MALTDAFDRERRRQRLEARLEVVDRANRAIETQESRRRIDEILMDQFRRDAEQKHAPVVIRDVLLALAVGQSRAQRWLIGLTAALVVLTAAIVALTVVLVLE
jgi:hypothetical protein